jgi:hypothetical protein
MRTLVPLLLAGWLVAAWGQSSWRIRQVADIESGMIGYGDVALGDTDGDSLAELSFWTDTPGQRVWRWETWEYRVMNRYELVKAETCIGIPEPPPGMSKGTFVPCDIGDADNDGLIELLGVNESLFYTGPQIDSVRNYVCIYESPDSAAYPDTLVWSHYYSTNGDLGPHMWYSGDLDRDGRKDIVFSASSWTYVLENRGDNQNELVWQSPLWKAGYNYAFDDFDQDSAREFVFSDMEWNGYVYVYECDGDDHYVLTDSVLHYWPNGYDVFSGNDLDQDGKPEFYVVYQRINPYSCFYICMYEAVANDSYEGTLVDSIVGGGISDAEHSVCSDIDGDGIEEMLVSYNAGIRVYKATGNNQFHWVWQWSNPTPGAREAYIQAHDINRNGYPDIVVSGNSRTWVFEMEAVNVLAPNGGESLAPDDTCLIRWRIYTPPRCDSVSLFLKTDTTVHPGEWFWRLDTIATGLAPTDSTFEWVVPPGPVESCRVVAIAYGPGWQYDESDAPFRILPGGVAEVRPLRVRDWALSVYPNPAGERAVVRFDVPVASDINLSLFDASGRQVTELASGLHQPGRYSIPLRPRILSTDPCILPSGIYFVRLDAPRFTMVRKAAFMRSGGVASGWY